MHKAVAVCQCVREVCTDWPEVDSASQCTVVACTFVIVSEMVSCADYTVFQEVVFSSDTGLKMAVFGWQQLVQVECYLQAVFHAERKIDRSTQSESGRQLLTVQFTA